MTGSAVRVEQTTDYVALSDLYQLGFYGVAHTRDSLRTAGMERATGRPHVGGGNAARYRCEPLFLFDSPQTRNGLEQFGGVRVLGVLEQRLDIRPFHYLAQVHDDDFLGHLRHDAQVVGNEHHRHAELVLKLGHELEYLGLCGDVQRGGWLVGDEQVGVAGQRHGNHAALSHATAQAEGVLVYTGLGVGDADSSEHLDRPVPRFLLGYVGIVQQNPFDDLLTDSVDRAEGDHRLLEDHGDVAASDVPHFRIINRNLHKVEDVLSVAPPPPAVVDYAALDGPAGWPDDTHDGPGEHALAAAALSHYAQDDTRPNVETDAVHGAHRSLIEEEVSLQVFDFEQRSLVQDGVLGLIYFGLYRCGYCRTLIDFQKTVGYYRRNSGNSSAETEYHN